MNFFTTPSSKNIIATLRIVTIEICELTFLHILYFHDNLKFSAKQVSGLLFFSKWLIDLSLFEKNGFRWGLFELANTIFVDLHFLTSSAFSVSNIVWPSFSSVAIFSRMSDLPIRTIDVKVIILLSFNFDEGACVLRNFSKFARKNLCQSHLCTGVFLWILRNF